MQQVPTETFDVSNYSETMRTFSQLWREAVCDTVQIGDDKITIKFESDDAELMDMKYEKRSNGCFVTLRSFHCVNPKTLECLVPGEHYLTKAISDFVTFFCDENQIISNLHIESSSCQHQQHSFFTIFRNTLGKLKRFIKVGGLEFRLDVGQPEMMKILPHLEPGFFDELVIESTKDHCAKWPRVTQLEQWKRLKCVKIAQTEIPIEKFLHLEFAYIICDLGFLTLEGLQKVIEEARNRENNKFGFRFSALNEFGPDIQKYLNDIATDVPPRTQGGYKYIKVPNKNTTYLKIEHRESWILIDRCDIN